MKVFELAMKLGQLLQETGAFQAFQEAEILALNDENLQDVLAELQRCEAQRHRSSSLDPGMTAYWDEKISTLRLQLEQMPRFKAWQQAKEQFDRLVTLALDQISYHISATMRTDVPCGVHAPPPVEMLDEPVFQVARQLAEALLDSDEYHRYEEAEKRFLTDDQVLETIRALRRDEKQLRSLDYGTARQGQALKDRIEALRQEVARRPSYRDYMAARNEFDRLLGTILDAISFQITGAARPETGCGTAGANCGCGSGLNLPPPQRIQRTLSSIT